MSISPEKHETMDDVNQTLQEFVTTFKLVQGLSEVPSIGEFKDSLSMEHRPPNGYKFSLKPKGEEVSSVDVIKGKVIGQDYTDGFDEFDHFNLGTRVGTLEFSRDKPLQIDDAWVSFSATREGVAEVNMYYRTDREYSYRLTTDIPSFLEQFDIVAEPLDPDDPWPFIEPQNTSDGTLFQYEAN